MEGVEKLTDPLVITALTGAFVTVIGSIVAGIVTILKAVKENTRQIEATNNKVDEAATKVLISDRKNDEIIEKAVEIKRLANGNLDKLRNDLQNAHMEIRRLNKQIAAQHGDVFKKFGIDRRKKKRVVKK